MKRKISFGSLCLATMRDGSTDKYIYEDCNYIFGTKYECNDSMFENEIICRIHDYDVYHYYYRLDVTNDFDSQFDAVEEKFSKEFDNFIDRNLYFDECDNQDDYSLLSEYIKLKEEFFEKEKIRQKFYDFKVLSEKKYEKEKIRQKFYDFKVLSEKKYEKK